MGFSAGRHRGSPVGCLTANKSVRTMDMRTLLYAEDSMTQATSQTESTRIELRDDPLVLWFVEACERRLARAAGRDGEDKGGQSG